jgi:hypothetical protein
MNLILIFNIIYLITMESFLNFVFFCFFYFAVVFFVSDLPHILFCFGFSSSEHVKDKSRSRDWKIKGK